jgi:hypothetical protein
MNNIFGTMGVNVMKVPLTGSWGRNESINCEAADEELITLNRAAVIFRLEPERR